MFIKKIQIIKDLLKGKTIQYLFLYGCAILSSLLEMLSIGIIFPFIALILKVNGDAGELPHFLSQIIEITLLKLNLEIACILLVAIFVFKNVARFLFDMSGAIVFNGLRRKWMIDIFSKYSYSKFSFFIDKKHGKLLSNLFNLTESCVNGYKNLVNLFMQGITVCVAVTVLLLLSWKVTIALLFVIITVYIVLMKPLTKRALLLGNSRKNIYQHVNEMPAETFKGMREIKSYSCEKNILNYYDTIVSEMARLRIRINFYQFLPTIFPEITIVVFLSGILIVINRSQGVDLNQFFPLMITYVYASLRLFNNSAQIIKTVIGFLNVWPSINYMFNEIHSDDYNEVSQGTNSINENGESVKFSNVCFFYQQRNNVLKEISVDFKKGEFTAIVGSSGSGKSTIADLIIRLHEPNSGAIFYNSIKIDEYPLIAWRKQIGFVSQDSFLFHKTIRENIVFGTTEDVSEDEIIEAAKKADAHDFIMTAQNGYDTVVGEKGAKLSGGQRQRIAIARALLRKPHILILDEATSALDSQTEKSVMDVIQKIKKDTILIVIAHRLSTVKKADKICVLKDGVIVEEGSHLELLKQHGEYYRLHSA